MKIMLMATPGHPKLREHRLFEEATLGIYVLGSILRNNGHDDIQFYDQWALDKYYTEEGWEKNKIRDLIDDCDLIGISANSFNWGTARELIDVIKKRKDSPFVMCGGVHPTYFDEHILQVTRADLIARGDTEKNLLKIVDAIKNKKSFHDIPGISFREGERIIRNPMETQDKYIDTPISCYEEMLQNSCLLLPLETSRGCPYNCAFCSISHRRDWRALDFEAAVKKIRQALNYIDRVELKKIHFVDDYFCKDLRRAVDILKWINTHEKNVRICLEARFNDFLHQDIDLAAVFSQGKIEINMGIECGYDEGLKKVGKRLLIKHIEEVFKKLYAYGGTLMRRLSVNMIVGFPWEDLGDCLKTIHYARDIKGKYRVGAVIITWWLPLISRLWHQQEQYGFRITPAIYDDPRWLTRKEFSYSVHAKLTEEDIRIIDRYTIIPKSRLMEKGKEIKGFEL